MHSNLNKQNMLVRYMNPNCLRRHFYINTFQRYLRIYLHVLFEMEHVHANCANMSGVFIRFVLTVVINWFNMHSIGYSTLSRMWGGMVDLNTDSRSIERYNSIAVCGDRHILLSLLLYTIFIQHFFHTLEYVQKCSPI